jgi:hypothetical protein
MAPHCARNPKTATILLVAEKAIQLNRLQGKLAEPGRSSPHYQK